MKEIKPLSFVMIVMQGFTMLLCLVILIKGPGKAATTEKALGCSVESTIPKTVSDQAPKSEWGDCSLLRYNEPP